MSRQSARGEGRTGGVQSVERAFQILEGVAAAGGVASISQLASDLGLPMPTIHRIMRTLVQLGYVRQEASRHYSLGPRLIRLGEVTATMLGRWARPHMAPLAQRLGESVNLAILDNDEVLYVGQVLAAQNSMRMFTEVGRRVPVHATAVGKVMLAEMPEPDVLDILARKGMAAFTARTITKPEDFIAALQQARQFGYATDEGEQETGVRCVAVRVPNAPQPMAISVSGPTSRMSDEVVEQAIGPLRSTAEAISAEINGSSSGVA